MIADKVTSEVTFPAGPTLPAAAAGTKRIEWRAEFGRVCFVGGLLAACLVAASMTHGVTSATGDSTLDSNEVVESSGLACSTRSDNLLWTHNDSGDSPRLFAFSRAGHVVAVVEVKKAKAVDWEDMCSFVHEGKHYLAVGDVGDNAAMRKEVVIYVCEEPVVAEPISASAGSVQTLSDKVAKRGSGNKLSIKPSYEIHVRYPQSSINCEALAFDPLSRQFLLATKENLQTRLYAVPFSTAKGDGVVPVTATLLGSFALPMITAADVSEDGKLLALGTYGPTCIVQRLTEGASPGQAASWNFSDPESLQFVQSPQRRQGEATCFDKGGKRLLLTSEGAPMPLYVVDIPAQP